VVNFFLPNFWQLFVAKSLPWQVLKANQAGSMFGQNVLILATFLYLATEYLIAKSFEMANPIFCFFYELHAQHQF